VLFAICVYLFLIAQLHPLRNDNFFLQNKINELTAQTQPAQAFLLQEQMTRQIILLVNQLQKNRDVPVALLEIANQIPASIILTDLTYKDNLFIVEGTGGPEVQSFAEQMTANKILFSQVSLNNVQNPSGTTTLLQPFKMTATVKYTK
jgi:Tfp pilus assembly protein PilN